MDNPNDLFLQQHFSPEQINVFESDDFASVTSREFNDIADALNSHSVKAIQGYLSDYSNVKSLENRIHDMGLGHYQHEYSCFNSEWHDMTIMYSISDKPYNLELITNPGPEIYRNAAIRSTFLFHGPCSANFTIRLMM